MPPSQNKTTINTLVTGQADLLPPVPPQSDRLRLFVSLGAIISLLLIVAVVSLNRQNIQDWWKLRGYQPPAAVAQLADQDTMNGYTRHLFYLNKPRLLSTVAGFRQYCPENKDTIVLGCYHPGQNGIFIYNVQDPALAGVQQVTAAHEVLHAVYARLSPKERTNLNTDLEDFYRHGLTDQRVMAEVKLYQQTEPTAVMDEMSCTFGTEVAKLPASLEDYYKRYFTNRAAIIAYEQQYQGKFISRQDSIKSDDRQLANMKQQISAQQAALSYQLGQINTDRSRLSSLLASGQTGAYNAAVPGFNNEIDTYNATVDTLRNAITGYNQLVASRNQLAGQLTTLDSAIDTRQIPQTAH
jgi:hypothetical protein